MKKLLLMILILTASTCYGDVFDDIVEEEESFNKNKVFGKEYRCDFPSSFLSATCDGDEYFYDEAMSSVKKNELSSFYRFVHKNKDCKGRTLSEYVDCKPEEVVLTDICVEILEPKTTDGQVLQCNDFGIILRPSH